MTVKIKKLHPNAVIPTYAKQGDAGMDLTAVSVKYEEDCFVYDTGLAIEIPEGYVGLLFPRSSLSKKDLILANHVGVLDSGYRGSVMLKFRPSSDYTAIEANAYITGDRIAQLIILPYPQIQFEEVDELSTTERADGGFGSTDVKKVDWSLDRTDF